MTKTKSVEAVVEFTVRKYSMVDLDGFLDMLRYDGAVVTGWDAVEAEDGRKYTIAIRKDGYFTIARWNSFGLRLEVKDWA